MDQMAGKRLQLGRPAAIPRSPGDARLDRVANPHPDTAYVARFTFPEFTALCPVTGQPDFATLVLDYVADRRCVELKSLKLYIWSFRNEGAFHEAVTNRILDDLVAALAPRFMRIAARFYVRGGIFTSVVVEHRKRGWKAAIDIPPVAFAHAASAV